jgi:hypothetical protein
MYSCKSTPGTQQTTEQNLPLMLADLRLEDTEATLYDLPESVLLPMSSLFSGYPLKRDDYYDARAYMDFICKWFEDKRQTACLAITLPADASTCLVFIYQGDFSGAFYVEEQKFTKDKSFVYNLLRSDPKATVEAALLTPEMISDPSGCGFGFNLS